MKQSLTVIFIFAFCAFGQGTTGSIDIIVVDTLGAVVPSAFITIENSKA